MAFQSMLLPELADQYRSSGLWLNKTIYEILSEKAARHPERGGFRRRACPASHMAS